MPIHELCLLVLVTAGALTDVKTGKIPNALTYPACVFGLARGLAEAGWVGLADSLAGLAFAFVPFFLLYLTGGMGAGDVKMMAAVGALMGRDFTLLAMINSVFFGALIALLIVIWEGRIRATARYFAALFTRLFRRGAESPELAAKTQVPFGVAICLASFMTLVASWRMATSPWHLIGQWAGGGF